MRQEHKDEIRRLWRAGHKIEAVKMAKYYLPIFTPLKRVVMFIRAIAD